MTHTALGPNISRAGFGRQGYCRLCSFTDEPALNQRIKEGWNATQIRNWLKGHYDVTVDRKTIYAHKPHVMNPADRVVSAVAKRQARGDMLPRVASNEQFLEAIRDLGYQKAMDNPDDVTIDHSLKAASILANSKRSGGEITLILAKVSVGALNAYDVIKEDVIEGEMVEVSSQ